jgi:HAE1 family hydrophobic/amphiphilic exporter-1
MGKNHFRAAHDGTDEIGLAVAATTFSILCVFIPIGFMPGVGGQWFKPFALTIASSVAVSLFVSFSLDPMLSAYWPDPHKEPHGRAWITRKLDSFNAWFTRQAENYKHVIAWALDHRTGVVVLAAGTFFASFILPFRGLSGLAAALLGIFIIVVAVSKDRLHVAARAGLAVVGLAVAIVLPRVVPPVRTVGSAFFPEDDRSEFIIALETPPGSNLEYTRLKAEEIGRLARSFPEVRYTYTTLGGGANGTVDVGSIYVRTVGKGERKRSVEVMASDLRAKTQKVAGATASVFVSDFGGGFKQIQLQLRGLDLAALNQAAEMVHAEVKKVPGAVDIGLSTKGQKPELEVELNRGVAGSLGVTVGQVAQSLRPAFAGIDAGDWVDPTGKSRNVTIRLTPESRTRAADLARFPLVVLGPNGAPSTIPLGQVATIREGVGPAIIDHLNRELVVTVELNTSGRPAGDVTNEITSRLAKLQLPAGVRYTIGGDAESQQEVFGQIFSALGLAILLMYLILVVQFGSFLDPIAIMLSLPLSLVGVMLALAIAGSTINLMSLIGVILLMGIVVKNAILLVDFAKWAREERGVPLREALIEAGAIRLRPILMTTFALIAGMLPIALGTGEGAQFRSPMGVAIIGGVITSTFLTLLVIPTGYEILDEWRSWFARKLGRTPKQMTSEHAVPATGD